MTKLPLRIVPGRAYMIVDANDDFEAGDYNTKAEAEEDRRGLTRFYNAHPNYLNPNFDRRRIMQLKRSVAVSMFESLGMKTAANWNKQRMAEKIATLENSYDADQKLPTPETQATFDAIFGAKVNDESIELVADDLVDEPVSEKPAKQKVQETKTPEVGKDDKDNGKAGKPKKEKKAKTAKTAATTPGVKKDRFGNRLGTGAAKFCAALTDEPKTMQELMAVSGEKDTKYNLCRKLAKAGLVKIEGRKYALATEEPVAVV